MGIYTFMHIYEHTISGGILPMGKKMIEEAVSIGIT